MSEQKLSHRQYRALLKKQRRREKRQAAAQLRDAQQKQAELPSESVEEDTSVPLEDNMEEDIEEMTEEQRKAHEAWLEREKVAQEEFRKRKAKEEAEKQKKIKEQRRIKEEWNAQQQREQEAKDKKEKELEDVLQQLDRENKQEKDAWPWHNPEPKYQSASTDPNRETCTFFLKTGACRFGERCSRAHPHPAISSTLMFPGMYSSYAIEQSFRDEYDTDIGLEYDEGDAYRNFVEFYEDVLPEFKALGKVVQFKVCCNWEPHLRGNVYVQFATEEECSKAYTSFNGRYYAGKRLVCQYTPVTKWKGAICGTFHYNKCPRGKNCNFLHVFINPRREFADADRDFQDQQGPRSEHWSRRSQYRGRGRSHDRDRDRSRSRDRRYRSRRRSRSRDRRRSYSRSRSRSRGRRRSYSRSRSRSRERRERSRDRYRRDSRSRSRSRGRSRSRDRHRSRSRSRSQERRRTSRKRSRSESRSRSRSRSRGRDKKKKRKHRNHSKDHKHKHSKHKVENNMLDRTPKLKEEEKGGESNVTDKSSDSESEDSDNSQRSKDKVPNGGSKTDSATSQPAEGVGVYPNLAHLIARDYGLLPTGDPSEPPTPSSGQRSDSAKSEKEESDREELKMSRSEGNHKKHGHKSKRKHKSKHRHKKQQDVSPIADG